jgi:hypothetical protein
MRYKDEEIDEKIKTALDRHGLTQCVDEGRLILAELILKAASGYCNSHTEEAFMNSFNLLRNDRTLNKKGSRFLCSMFYSHSNKRPVAFGMMEKYRL